MVYISLGHSRNVRYALEYEERTLPANSSNTALLDFAAELQVPDKRVIPAKISRLYHIEGNYFEIFRQIISQESGFRGITEEVVTKQNLLYSEAYTEAMHLLDKRGLFGKLEELKARREQEFQKIGVRRIRIKGFEMPREEWRNIRAITA